MKAATIQDLKEELQHNSPARILELCLRLARFKKENKELLTFLLFESNDIKQYIQNVKNDLSNAFLEINTNTIYFAKKSLRKILRLTNKYIRYSNSKLVETELLMHFCKCVQAMDVPIRNNAVIRVMYENQIRKIHKAILSLHEDLQFDYRMELEGLETSIHRG